MNGKKRIRKHKDEGPEIMDSILSAFAPLLKKMCDRIYQGQKTWTLVRGGLTSK